MTKAVGRIVVLLACLGSVRAPAPQVHDPYSDALQAYRSDPGGGITRLLALPDAEQSRGTRDFLSRPQLAADAACAAAMMQTDAALYSFENGAPTAGVRQLSDGEALLLKAVALDEDFLEFEWRWYRTVAALLTDDGQKALAEEYDGRARLNAFDTPVRQRAFAALDRGIGWEYEAGRKGEFLTIEGLSKDGRNLAERYLDPAAHEFAAALAALPSLHVAHLHLARVRMLQGDRDEAVGLFTQAASARVRSVRYLARLFLGADAERRADLGEARTLYETAVSDFPAGQSAYLALAHLSERMRDSAATASAIARFRSRSLRNLLADPWWDYFNTDQTGFDAPTALRVLRGEVLR